MQAFRVMTAERRRSSDGARLIAEAPIETAVLDAAGCERVVLVASAHPGPFAVSYAAMHPDRVTALVLINSHAHYVQEDDYPCGLSPDALDRFSAAVRET